MSDNYDIDVDVLREVCPIFNDQQKLSSLDTRYKISEYGANILNLKDTYITQVEVGNRLIENILRTEEEYFSEKYGPQLYEYLKSKREDYMKEKLISECDQAKSRILGPGSTTNILFESADMGKLLPNLKTDISDNVSMYNKFQDNAYLNDIQDISKKTDILNKNIVDMYSKSSVSQRKIEYRSEELKKMNKWNNIITTVYYALVVFYMVYLFGTDKLNIKKNLLFYTILLLFPPIIYPWIFKQIRKLLKYLSFNMELHGPKNAFLNQEIDLNFVDNHDI